MRQWVETGRVPSVLLITGAAGIGKREMVYYLSQWLLCDRTGFSKSAQTEPEAPEVDEGPGLFGALSSDTSSSSSGTAAASPPATASGEVSLQPCGTCLSCQKAVQGAWVDFLEIAPEEDESGTSSGQLKIDQFRQLKTTMGFGAFDGAFRITLIRGADRMTVQAANSLLKLLEEPPPGWILFMTAADSSLILPTLLSRSQTIRLKPFDQDQLRALLRQTDLPIERHAICADLAQGSWGRAMQLARPETWDNRAAVFRFLEKPQAELVPLVDWASQEPANLHFLLDQLELICSELIRSTLGSTTQLHTQALQTHALQIHAKEMTRRLGSKEAAREFWIERARRVFRARIESMAPLNKKILIQDILIPFV